MVSFHGLSSRRISSFSPYPSAVNDSLGPIVPSAGPWGVHTPKPANRIPSPPRNQAASDSESPAPSRKLPHRSGRSRRRGRIARGLARLVGRIGMPSHDKEQHEETHHIGERHVPAVVKPAPDRFRF